MRYVIAALLCLVTVADAHASDAIWESLRTPGSVVSDLTGLNVRMGTFVVLRRTTDGRHAVVGELFVE